MTIKWTAAVFAAFLAAVAIWAMGASTASAPEPARLTQSLAGSTGALASAVYVNSNTNTTVVKWTTSWMSVHPLPEAGKPCSPYDLAAWQETTRVIYRSGSYAKCA